MKKIQLSVIFTLTFFSLFSQVTIQPVPAPGFEKRIKEHIDTLKVVDTHEHLIHPKEIIHSGMFDFMLLLHHYADDDIQSGGMPKPVFAGLLTASLTSRQKWEVLKPYWDKSFNTAYNRVVLLTATRLFGLDKLDETTVDELTDKIRKAYQTDWYQTVLKDKCRIEYLINDSGDRSFGDRSMFRYAQQFTYNRICSKKDIEQIARNKNRKIETLDDLVNTLHFSFEQALPNGFVTIKSCDAYFRSLYYEDVNKEKAGEVFNLIMNCEQELPFETVKPLSDYMMHRMLDLAQKHNKPVQVHTGLQAGDGNYIENSNPVHLANLFHKYRDVRFILFHGGYPYGSEQSG